MRVTREIALWVSWKPTYPRYTLAAADSAQGCKSGTGTGVEGVSMELFFCPQLRGHLPADGSPREEG